MYIRFASKTICYALVVLVALAITILTTRIPFYALHAQTFVKPRCDNRESGDCLKGLNTSEISKGRRRY